MRRALVIGLFLFAIVAVWSLPTWWSALWFDAGRKPQFDSRNPVAIDLAVAGDQIATITNTDALMSLLRGGRHVEAHRCSSRGKLSLHYADGREQAVGILPGHSSANYEFVYTNDFYAVPRAEFMSILASVGIATNEIPVK